jgi:GNAT superfamily N-acetyltransferase
VSVYRQIAEERVQASTPIREQLLRRIHLLEGDADLHIRENLEAFGEVTDAWTPPTCELQLVAESRCRACDEGGGLIQVDATINLDGERIGRTEREFSLAERVAKHRLFFLQLEHRGRGLGANALIRAVTFYREADVTAVHLHAGLLAGRWYWAQWGFDFRRADDRSAVQAWAQRVLHALGVVDANATDLERPSDFLFLNGAASATIRQLGELIRDRQRNFAEIATHNAIGMDEAVELGKLILLTGPDWEGILRLGTEDEVLFNHRAQRSR